MIKVLPRDRDVVVYLGYDLLYLGKYKELLQLTDEYTNILTKEPDIPLLAGYAHKHNRQLEEAREDFTEALRRDPEVVTAYVNLGYVLNDLHQPDMAAQNFEAALQRDSKNGEAHLGLAYSNLDLQRPGAALKQAQLAEQYMGDSEPIHLIRATAYGRMGMLANAASEYRAALKFSPNDGGLHFGLGNVLFSQRHYHDSVDELQIAERLLPGNADVSALMARAYANLGDHDQTMHYVLLAEQQAQGSPAQDTSDPDRDLSFNSAGNHVSQIYVSTGQALDSLGNQKAAMERFRKALLTKGSNRISVRLAIAQVMAQQGHSDDAQRQIALGLMESETGETAPPTPEQYVEAADVFRSMHEYEMSQTYLERAESAGASDVSVRLGLADNYLALGQTSRAASECRRSVTRPTLTQTIATS